MNKNVNENNFPFLIVTPDPHELSCTLKPFEQLVVVNWVILLLLLFYSKQK